MVGGWSFTVFGPMIYIYISMGFPHHDRLIEGFFYIMIDSFFHVLYYLLFFFDFLMVGSFFVMGKFGFHVL